MLEYTIIRQAKFFSLAIIECIPYHFIFPKPSALDTPTLYYESVCVCVWGGGVEGGVSMSLQCFVICIITAHRSIPVAEWLALPTSVHGVVGSNPAGGEILPEPKRLFIAQSLSCSPFHHLEMTEILLKECKTLTHPSILILASKSEFF